MICIMYVGRMDFHHLVARSVQYHCTQCQQLKMHCHQSGVILPGGSTLFVFMYALICLLSVIV